MKLKPQCCDNSANLSGSGYMISVIRKEYNRDSISESEFIQGSNFRVFISTCHFIRSISRLTPVPSINDVAQALIHDKMIHGELYSSLVDMELGEPLVVSDRLESTAATVLSLLLYSDQIFCELIPMIFYARSKTSIGQMSRQLEWLRCLDNIKAYIVSIL